MFLYKATLNRVVSPVTISCNVDLGFGIQLTEAIRLNGVSMPATPGDKAKAVAIIDDWVNRHPVFVLHTYKNKEKFGRFLGTLMDRHGGTLNQKLLDSHVVEEIPECEIPEEENEVPEVEDEVEEVEVEESELPEVEEETETAATESEEGEEVAVHIPGELPSDTGDLLEEIDDADLAEEIAEEKKTRKKWRLKRKAA